MDIPKITTSLMFSNQAEKVVKLYTSLFEDSKIITMAKYDESEPGDPGTIQHSIFTLNGRIFMTISTNSGTELPVSPAISLFVMVKDTIEMGQLFDGLKDEGAILMPKTSTPPRREFAWIQDKPGISL